MGRLRIIRAWPASPLFLAVSLAAGLLLYAASLTGLMVSFRLAGLGVAEAYAVSLVMVTLAVLLSPFNLVVAEYESRVLMPVVRQVEFFGIPIPIPEVVYTLRKTTVTVNLGGCVVPVAVSLFMLYRLGLADLGLLAAALAAVLAAALLVHPVSRIVSGVGVVVPGLYPPPLGRGSRRHGG